MVALAVSQSLATLEWLGGHFSPATLFATSEPGVWYDPSDVANTLWLYNLLTFTEQFDNAAWAKSAVGITANSTTAPNGTLTADTCTPDTTTAAHLLFQTTTVSGSNVQSMYVKANGYTKVSLREGQTGAYFASFDLSGSGSVLFTSSATATITAVGNGWFRIAVVGTLTGTTRLALYVLDPSYTTGSVTSSWTPNGTSGIFIWGAQVELGSTATTYQPITTVAAETIARFPYATLYQDSAGTTPVTAPNQPVGLMLDKSQGLVLGSELVTNGDFSSATGWTAGSGWTISGGVATATTSPGTLTQSISITANRTYAITFTVASIVGAFRVRLGGSTNIVNTTLANGTYTYLAVAEAVDTNLLFAFGTGGSGSIDNISVKLLPGNHATQSTSGSRPTYGIVPATGRRNLLTYSEQFDNAAWTKQGIGAATAPVVTANAGIAPDGTTTADRVQMSLGGGTTTGDISTINQLYSFSAGNYTSSFWIRSNTGADQTVQLTIEGVGITVFTVTPTWQKFSGIRNATGLSSSVALRLRGTFTGNTADIFVWGAQLETGSTATAYQQVVTAFEVTEANVASLSYISFDGIDDFMVTPTITPGTNKAQVFAGVRKLSDASSYGVVAELGADAPQGAFTLLAPHIGATFSWLSKGTGGAYAVTSTAFPAPTTNILTGIGDIAADTANLRVNGTQAATSTTDQGTGNYLAYPLYIGRRGGTTLPFNGQMYGLITRFGANLNTSQLVSTEGWVNTKTGAY